MLVVFNTPIEFLKEQPAEKLQDVFEEVVRAYRRGTHVVVIDRRVATWLADNIDLNSRGKSALRALASAYAQTGGLANNAQIYCSIEADGVPFDTEGRRIRVPFSRFKDTNILDKPILLVEDEINDGRLYDQVLDIVARNEKLASLSYEPRHGGGSSIIRLIPACASLQRAVAIVLDSDVLSPFDQNQSKLRRYQSAVAETGWPVGTLLMLPCREIENLIPYEAIANLQLEQKHKSALGRYIRIENVEAASKVQLSMQLKTYIDLKFGISAGQIANIKNPEEVAWWREKLGDDDICGFGDSLARRVAEESIAILRRELSRQPFLERIVQIFKEIVWLFASGRPIRV